MTLIKKKIINVYNLFNIVYFLVNVCVGGGGRECWCVGLRVGECIQPIQHPLFFIVGMSVYVCECWCVSERVGECLSCQVDSWCVSDDSNKHNKTHASHFSFYT